MSDTSSPEARSEALADILDAVERFVDAGGASTITSRAHIFALCTALQLLASRHEAYALADSCEAFIRRSGL